MKFRVCDLTGKRRNAKARTVTFSHTRNHKVQQVNLQTRRLWWEEGNRYVKMRISTKAIKVNALSIVSPPDSPCDRRSPSTASRKRPRSTTLTSQSTPYRISRCSPRIPAPPSALPSGTREGDAHRGAVHPSARTTATTKLIILMRPNAPRRRVPAPSQGQEGGGGGRASPAGRPESSSASS